MIISVPDESVREVDSKNRVTLLVSAVHDHEIIAMESLEPKLMDAVTAFAGSPRTDSDVEDLRDALRKAADPGTYAGEDV